MKRVLSWSSPLFPGPFPAPPNGGGEEAPTFTSCWVLLSLPKKDTVFQVDLLGEVHLAGDGGENQPLLATVREREFNFSVQASWPQ